MEDIELAPQDPHTLLRYTQRCTFGSGGNSQMKHVDPSHRMLHNLHVLLNPGTASTHQVGDV